MRASSLLHISTAALLAATALTACHSGIPDWADDPRGNFDALWTLVDEHYCFFGDKADTLDWDEVYARYSPRVSEGITSEELFVVCSQMLDELRDGHVNLSSPYATSYYRAWWSDYPQNYDQRLVEQYYFNFNQRQLGVFSYGFLPGNIGYLRCSSFTSSLGEGNLDYILQFLATAQALIVDVRDNGGGDLTNAETLARRFLRQKTLAGYLVHKTGPGHTDFSEPYPLYYYPIGDGHTVWGKPVVVLTNRSTFSAANNFVSVMKPLPWVTIVGATTGGGSGMPVSYELPCGWGLRLSALSILDAQGRPTEAGIDPTEGCAVDLDPAAALAGHDTILDFAIALIEQGS